ncbi:hypothetical protein A3C67_02995 [Candidatus Nomurabacteria bacterium RIFCSPHIGHO2_02_FULL_42_19]|uniref:Type 4a pilus biogenesis protein PilO n=1 Tax=Candidatus Nomurabacteria bacterium RIFCSPHIGHO2_02_FULL_42_19 TaxID=1801756 RepID=A0A1F6W1R7_9BACT|nr:MAG: hypothetical protein A3C67_02995 [Candidatus Nomurabacteria bacterium RIFCSPHIGHO2_02_FULL_42_19]
MQNNFQKFKKIPLILSTALLLLSCFVFIFLYRQTQNNYQTSAELEMERQSEVNRQDEIKSLERLLQTIEKEYILLNAHFIQGSDIVPFLNMTEKLAGDAGAKAEVILVEVPKDNSGLVVGVNATGSFEALYKFLTLLENSPYELDFISMTLETSAGGGVLDSKNPAPQWAAVFKIKLLSFIP